MLGQLYWNMGEETRKDRSKAQTHLLKVCALHKIWHLGRQNELYFTTYYFEIVIVQFMKY